MQEFFSVENRIIYLYLLVFLSAWFIVWYAIPSVIYVAKRKRLLDVPTGRKKHTNVTPNLAGVAIFSSFAFVCSLFQTGRFLPEWNYIFAGAFLLFVIGLKDDLVPMSAFKKFLAQIGAAFIIVVLADLRIDSLHGFLGMHKLPYLISIILTSLIIIFVTNAYNLIDGIDALAGTQGLIGFSFLSIFFTVLGGNFGLAMISFCMTGALLGFLKYNRPPAKIFMGDTGSLQLGYLLSIVSIAMINKYEYAPQFSGSGGIGLAIAILFIPAFDTLRVFTTRILKGHSPFDADRTHIHHILMDAGFTGKGIVMILAAAKILFIGLALALKHFNPTYTAVLLLIISISMMTVAMKARNRNLGNKASLIPVNVSRTKAMRKKIAARKEFGKKRAGVSANATPSTPALAETKAEKTTSEVR